MEYIEIKSRSYNIIRKGLGVLMAIIAIAWFMAYISSRSIIYIAGSFFFLLYGIYQITNGLGLERTWIKADNDSLSVKWNNRINPVRIHTSRIARISLERARIIIFQRSLKPLKLNLGFLEKSEKMNLYNFIIEFARKSNIDIERHSSTKL
jgi:hypothetical protein